MRGIFWFYFIFCSLGVHSQKSELDSLLKVARLSQNDSLQIEALNAIAFRYIFSDAPKAQAVIEEGERIAYRNKFYFGIAQMTNTHGIYMDVIGKSDSANYYFSKALKLSREKRIPLIEAKCLNNLGMFHWNRSNYKKALAYFFDSLKMNEDLGNQKATATPLNNIGLIYQEMNMYEDALEYHRKSLDLREKYELQREQVASLNNIGICLKSLGELDQAIEILNRGIQLAKSSGNYLDFYKLYDTLGNVYSLKGDLTNALNSYLSALNTKEGNHDDSRGKLSANNNIVALYNKMQEPQKALQYAEEGLRILEKNPNLETYAIDIHLNRAESLFMLDRDDIARKSLEKYVALQDSLFSESNAKALAELETKYETAKKEKELFEQREQLAKRALEIKRKNTMIYGSLALAFLLGLIGYLFYGQQLLKNTQLLKEAQLKTALLRIETQNQLQEQRLHISRDLHDSIGSNLTFIISTIDTLGYGFRNGDKEIKAQLSRLSKFAKNTINELRDTIWAMNKESISFEDLHYRIISFISQADTSSKDINFEFVFDTVIDQNHFFTANEGIHIYRIIQESVTNALKYAFSKDDEEFKKITVHIYQTRDFFHIQIEDTGSGFDQKHVLLGNGINNMHKRAQEIDGKLEINADEQKGTIVNLKLPVRYGKRN
ncbi:tetratricopeptide repeat protein [Maribacter sp. X9]|uniref:ATP-binding protein n=1 Tax=Maribacter sp. X9 TaxID=3402159 RepID=UPI003AF40317